MILTPVTEFNACFLNGQCILAMVTCNEIKRSPGAIKLNLTLCNKLCHVLIPSEVLCKCYEIWSYGISA